MYTSSSDFLGGPLSFSVGHESYQKHPFPPTFQQVLRAFPLLILTQTFVAADSARQRLPTTEKNIPLNCFCAERIQFLVIIP